jgi:hypothetical protein
MMFLGKNHRHTGMDLRDDLVRLARNNRAGAQPFSRAEAKVNGRPSFMGSANGSFGFAVLCHS